MPSAKTDLRGLDRNTDTVVWLGHFSYFVQLGGRRLLIDPVFSTYASPVFFANRAFEGTNLYTAEDMPDIDYLLISHDHWDHLDYATATALRSKVGQVVCPLGVGAHLRLGATARKRFSRETGIPSLRGKAASPSTSCPPAISRAAH
ncbi:MAG: MBL fold metallo-hydrolase [Bilophila wadsworthia]